MLANRTADRNRIVMKLAFLAFYEFHEYAKSITYVFAIAPKRPNPTLTASAAIPSSGIRVLFHLPFEGRAGQAIEQPLEVRLKQISPFLLKPHKQFLLMLQQPIQATIQ